MRRNDKHWNNLRLNAFRERAAPLTKCLCALIQITAWPGRPRGGSTFLHLVVRPWNPIPFFQMASEAADLVGLASFDPPSDPVQPKQPSHYWLQLFGTGNLILVPHWRPICEVVWWKSLPLLWPQFSVLGKQPNWFTVNQAEGGVGRCFLTYTSWSVDSEYMQWSRVTLLEWKYTTVHLIQVNFYVAFNFGVYFSG